jgi:two-component system sensor histidine kinase and response regulator WspE
MSANFSDAELLEFLFLPGFSTAAAVTDISGRGVGLDAVQDMVKSVGGAVRLTSRAGKGVTFSLELPLTLSVLRTLVIEIGGEPFALPLTRIAKAVVVPLQGVARGQHKLTLDGEPSAWCRRTNCSTWRRSRVGRGDSRGPAGRPIGALRTGRRSIRRRA